MLTPFPLVISIVLDELKCSDGGPRSRREKQASRIPARTDDSGRMTTNPHYNLYESLSRYDFALAAIYTIPL